MTQLKHTLQHRGYQLKRSVRLAVFSSTGSKLYPYVQELHTWLLTSYQPLVGQLLLFTNKLLTHILSALSVDAEHAFSGGHLQVSHLQHGISSQTFKACVALGSWVNTLLLPGDIAASILEQASSPSNPGMKHNGKGKAKEVIFVDAESSTHPGHSSD